MAVAAVEPQQAGLTEFFRYIQESEYDVRWQDAAGTIQAPNRAQNLRVSFYHDGFGAVPRETAEGQSEWSLTILLDQVGREGRTARPTEAEAQWTITAGEARQRLGDMVVEYQNTPEGLRQNFYLDTAPPGSGPVRIMLTVETSGLTTVVNEALDGLRFTDAGTGDGGLNFDGLRVWDSRGEPLPASFIQTGENSFAIEVNDTGAVYPVTVDPWMTLWGTYTSPQSGASYGSSLAYGGSISSSITASVLIGAPYYDDGQTDEGKVFVFNLDSYSSTPVWTAQVDQAYGNFGKALIGNFDVDDDGYMDVAIGAPAHGSGGKVWMWKGSSSGLSGGSAGTTGNAHWSAQGGSGDWFGSSLAVGDFTDSGGSGGTPDLLVGSPAYTISSPVYAWGTGKVSLFGGTGSTFVSSASWTATGDYYCLPYQGGTCWWIGSEFGHAVANVGDLNGDGRDDFAVGAPRAAQSGTEKGRVSTYLGATGSPSTSTVLYAGVSGAKFGWAIAGGFLDGDSYSDIIVGAPYDANGQSQEGRVYGYSGSSSGLSSSAGWTWENNEVGGHLGWSVAYRFEPNGVRDVIAGGPDIDNPFIPAVNTGAVHFWYLDGNGDPIDDYLYYNVNGAANDRCGVSVCWLGGAKIGVGIPNSSSGGYVQILLDDTEK